MNDAYPQAAPSSRRASADKRLHAFEVFGDYVPSRGSRVLIRVRSTDAARMELLQRRAGGSELLDPALAQGHMRAGLALVRCPAVAFAWANAEGAVILLREDAGPPAPIENELRSRFAARLALLLGHELEAEGHVFEMPDLTVVRRALTAMVEDVEEATPLRSSLWLGAQLKGRGQAFHPSMIETLEEQSSLLQANGIDMDALPSWWWRGMAATPKPGGGFDVVEDVPPGDAFGQLVVD